VTVLLYRFMTGFWEPVEAASPLAFLTEAEEGKDLLDEMASLDPRQCFGVESMISQTVTSVPCETTRERSNAVTRVGF
jgi:hypothetical protein